MAPYADIRRKSSGIVGHLYVWHFVALVFLLARPFPEAGSAPPSLPPSPDPFVASSSAVLPAAAVVRADGRTDG